MPAEPKKSAPAAAAVHPYAAAPSDAVQLHDDEQGPSAEEVQQAELLRKRLIFGIGAVPAVASILGLLGWLWWPFHAMDLFRVQYSVLLVLMIALALWVRQWKVAGLFLLPVLLNVWLVSPLFLSPQWAAAVQLRSIGAVGDTPAAAQSHEPPSANVAAATLDESAGAAVVQVAERRTPDIEETPYGTIVNRRPVEAAPRRAAKAKAQRAADDANAAAAESKASSPAGPSVEGQIMPPAHSRIFDDMPWPAPADASMLKSSVSLLLYHCAARPTEAEGPFEFLRTSSADVLLLQGVTPEWIDPLRWRVAPYRVHKSATHGGQFGQAVLGRFHYPSDESTIAMASRQLNLLPAAHVPAFETVVTLQQGKVAVLSIGLPLPLQADAARQQALMMEMISFWVRRQTLPVVVIGNLGTTPWSSAFKNLLSDTGLINSQIGHGLQATWPAQGGLPFGSIPIDHVLHSPDVTITQRKILPAVLSSHHALQVELTLDADAAISADTGEDAWYDKGQQARRSLFRH